MTKLKAIVKCKDIQIIENVKINDRQIIENVKINDSLAYNCYYYSGHGRQQKQQF